MSRPTASPGWRSVRSFWRATICTGRSLAGPAVSLGPPLEVGIALLESCDPCFRLGQVENQAVLRPGRRDDRVVEVRARGGDRDLLRGDPAGVQQDVDAVARLDHLAHVGLIAAHRPAQRHRIAATLRIEPHHRAGIVEVAHHGSRDHGHRARQQRHRHRHHGVERVAARREHPGRQAEPQRDRGDRAGDAVHRHAALGELAARAATVHRRDRLGVREHHARRSVGDVDAGGLDQRPGQHDPRRSEPERVGIELVAIRIIGDDVVAEPAVGGEPRERHVGR